MSSEKVSILCPLDVYELTMCLENMRRMFYRWLTAARKARHRRLYLQQKEDELKSTVIAAAWDKWRERFLDIRLQPIVSYQKHSLHQIVHMVLRRTISLFKDRKISCSVPLASGTLKQG